MDWLALPMELLQEIAKKLATVVEFVRFRAVCRWWRSAANPADLPPQQPWLMLPYHPDGEARSFLCLSTGIVRVLRLPETRNKRICGSGHGWFILFEDETLYNLHTVANFFSSLAVVTLLNPLTGSVIRLPPLRAPAGMLVSASLSGNPTSSSGCILAVSFLCPPTMAFCCLCPDGSTWWSMPETELRFRVKSIAYHHGKLCTIDYNNSFKIWDTKPQRLLIAVDLCVEFPSLGEGGTLKYCQLVDSTEELVLVAYGCDGNPDPASRVDCSMVYILDSESKQLKLNRAVSESLGHEVHLLYVNPVAAVSTGVYVACKGCLYFARCNDGVLSVNVLIKKLDLKKDAKKDAKEELQFESDYLPGFVSEATWLVPSLI